MNDSLIIAMIQTLMLLFAVTFMFGLSINVLERYRSQYSNIILGVTFGMFGIFNMILGVEIVPGVVVDLRNPIVLVVGIYGGSVSAFISAFVIALYRIIVIGGVGAFPAVLSIFSVALFVSVLRRRFKRLTILLWMFMGVVSVWISAFWATIFLPPEINQIFLMNFLPVTMFLYPFLSVVLGKLVGNEYDRLTLQKALNVSEKRFRAIFDKSFQFVGLLKPDGVLIEANQTALDFAGVELQDVVGQYFWQAPWWALSIDSQDRLKEAIQRAAKGEFIRYRTDVIGANGQIRTIDFSLKPVWDEDGRVILLIPEGRDMTSEIIAEQQRMELTVAHETTNILKQFIEDSSHHLRTPVTIMRTSEYVLNKYLEQVMTHLESIMAEPDIQQNPEVMAQLKDFQTLVTKVEFNVAKCGLSLESLIQLIEELLELTRLNQVDNLMMEPIDFVDIVRSETDNYMTLTETSQFNFQLQLPDQPLVVYGDNIRLQLIVQNLLENATRYTSAGGQIDVRCVQQGNDVILTVRDNGIGIPDHALPHIFERFYRAANAQSHTSSGTGLGLAIVRKIIESHQGTIQVESVVDHGTTFIVTLPIMTKNNENKPMSQSTSIIQ